MASRVSNWGPVEWEAYALSHCKENKAPGTDFTRYESWGTWVQGKMNIIRDHQRKIVVIQFRGSCNMQNYVNDLDCRSVAIHEIFHDQFLDPYGESRTIHSGFSREYFALQQQFGWKLYNEVVEKTTSNWYVLLTGHSLGGALATLCTADILQKNSLYAWIQVNRIALVTFGSPRPGNHHFANWIHGAGLHVHLRVEIEYDPIVTLPAENGGAFSHCGRQVLIKRQSNEYKRVSISDSHGETDGVIKAIGNVCSFALKPFDLVSTGVSAGLSSAIGVVVDHLAAQAFELDDVPIFRHGDYWKCRQYDEIDLTVPKAPVAQVAQRVIYVLYDVGWENALYIRGEGPLSWWQGVKMENQGQYWWKWVVPEGTTRSFPFKVLRNDRDWETGNNHIWQNAEWTTITPKI